MKKITLTIFTAFLTLMSLQTNAQFLESFDTEIPHDWTVIDNDGQGGTWQYHSGDAYRGTGEARINFEQEAHDDYLISPQFTVNSGSSDQLSFYAGGTGITFPESFDVKLSTTGTNPSDFTVLLGSEVTIADVDDLGEYVNYTYNLAAYNGQPVYIAIVATATAAFHLYIDEFSVEALPPCPKPSNLNIENLTPTSVDLHWSAGGSENEWTAKYGPQGFDPESEGETKTVNGSPTTTLTNLDPGSVYEVYVKAVCGNGNGESQYAGPLAFFTPCLPGQLPFSEGFENSTEDGTELAGCWSQQMITGSKWKVNTSMTSNSLEPRSESWDIYLYYGSESWIFYPLQLEQDKIYTLTFYARESHTAGADLAAAYGLSNTSADMVNEIIPTTEITDGDYQEISGSFSPATSGVFYIGIKGHMNGGFFPFYMALDDISVEETPSCFKPTNLQIENASPTTADISWSPGGSETDWLIKYGEPGFDPASEGLSATANGTPNTTLENLTPAHIYNVFVQSQCGGEDGNSSFAGPITLKTTPVNDELCNATPLIVDGGCSGNNFSNVGATMQTDEPLGTCYDAPGDQTVWFSFEAPTGGNVTVTTDFEGGTLEDTEIAIFEAPTDCGDLSTLGMQLGCDEDGGSTGMGFLSVATLTGLTPGSMYYIQVNGFLSFDEGTAEGTFCIEVQDNGPSCPAPTDIVFDEITPTTAALSWSAGGNESEWEIIYGLTGFDPNSGGNFIVDNDGLLGETLTDLLPETSYDVYVRALCGTNDESELSTVATFSTPVAPPINDNLCDATPLIVDEMCSGNTYTNVGATLERDEIQGDCISELPVNTVWFSFEAPQSGNVTVSTNIEPSELQDSQMTVYGVPTDCTSFTTLGESLGCNDDTDAANNQLLSTVVLTDLTAGETYYVQINGKLGAEGSFCLEVHDDGIACPAPTDLTVTDITTNSADINWTADASENEWEIKYGPTAFDPTTSGTSVMDNNGTPGETLTDLLPNSSYDVYVRAICNLDTQSDYTGPESFITEMLSTPDIAFGNFTFYPNPVKNEMDLKANFPIEKVIIYNLLGQEVIGVEGDNPHLTLNLSSLQQGVYFMKVNLLNSEKIFRIIKE